MAVNRLNMIGGREMSKRSSVMLRSTVNTIFGGIGSLFLVPLSIFVSVKLVNSGFNFDEFPVVMVLGMLAITTGSVLIFKVGLDNVKLAKKVKSYIPPIVNENIISIDTIAVRLGLSNPNIAMSEIDNLIQLGFLPGFVIDRGNRIVSRPIEKQKVQQTQEVSQSSVKPEILVFTCKACGANNAVLPIGGVARCEYCDVAVK